MDVTVPVACDLPPGTAFDLGTTTVSCGAVDKAGNAAYGRFTVTVRDDTPPQLTLPGDMSLEATKAAGRDVEFFPTASDLVDGEVPVTCTPTSGAPSPLGPTTVRCSAVDSRGMLGLGQPGERQ